jgi:tetratricopeptide (TPR) repeat protein
MNRTANIVKVSLICLLSLIGMLLLGCGGSNNGTKPEKSAQELTADGWSLFESGDLDDAQLKFDEALTKDADYADAYNGKGWCAALLDQETEALSHFLMANDKGLDKPDAHVGLAGIYLGQEEFESAITHAWAALSMDSNYVFSHQTSIDYLDLHLILAQAYYGLGGDYLDSSQVQVDYLNPTNDLDPTNPATWTVNGQIYNSYAEALLKEIQRLEETIGES